MLKSAPFLRFIGSLKMQTPRPKRTLSIAPMLDCIDS
uniref:Uncharacterized protein n=1 Tax=Myoviridae sp. cti9m5 TaxID=2827613 RepID=A0A8S5LP53_9CAUD|nr:MAG TPA: hypothetical protein [Myoviridae sp. cti9m5]